MAWKIDELISWLSRYITLKPGDIIFTGTPAGVSKLNPNDNFIAEKLTLLRILPLSTIKTTKKWKEPTRKRRRKMNHHDDTRADKRKNMLLIISES